MNKVSKLFAQLLSAPNVATAILALYVVALVTHTVAAGISII